MIISVLAKLIGEEFPDLTVAIGAEEKTLTIPPEHPDIGSIEIQEDDDELIVVVGRFTHWHAGCYEENFSAQERAEYIAETVIDYLRSMFDDKVVMWGSHRGGGGSYLIGSDSAENRDIKSGKWLWSGKTVES